MSVSPPTSQRPSFASASRAAISAGVAARGRWLGGSAFDDFGAPRSMGSPRAWARAPALARLRPSGSASLSASSWRFGAVRAAAFPGLAGPLRLHRSLVRLRPFGHLLRLLGFLLGLPFASLRRGRSRIDRAGILLRFEALERRLADEIVARPVRELGADHDCRLDPAGLAQIALLPRARVERRAVDSEPVQLVAQLGAGLRVDAAADAARVARLAVLWTPTISAPSSLCVPSPGR